METVREKAEEFKPQAQYEYGWVADNINSHYRNWVLDLQYGSEEDKNAFYKETYEEYCKGNDFYCMEVE